jgi:ankyrin repeat protein
MAKLRSVVEQMESEFRRNQEQEVIKHRLNLNKQLNICLYEASKEGRANEVEFSLSKDASIHFVDSASGYTSLMIACRNGYEKVVELLLSHGANVHDKKTTDGASSL